MKFLIDAQLPRRLVAQLRQAGLDAIHTFDLPDGNRTTDRIINELSINEQYIVVTKDSDFVVVEGFDAFDFIEMERANLIFHV